MNRLLLLTLVVMSGCGGPVEPRPPDAVTAVTVTGDAQVASEGTTVLTASVEGTGTYSSEVSWSLVSGEGTLSDTSGASVTYTAPFAREQTTVTVQAMSQADASKVATFTLTVARAPPASLLEGTYFGTLSSIEVITSASGPVGTRDITAETFYEFTRVSDTQAQLTGPGYVGMGFPAGIPVEVHEDGTLTLPPQTGQRRLHDKYCWQQFFIGESDSGPPGVGSWDAQGNLTLNWIIRLEQMCTVPGTGGATRETFHHITSAFTGTKR